MSGTLDKFFGASPLQQTTEKEQRCCNPSCRKILKGVKYTFTGKHAGTYCQDCAKKILRPQETTEENL